MADKPWLTMAPEGMRTLVTIMESGAVQIAENLTPAEVKQVERLLSMHTSERLREEQMLRERLAKLTGG